MDSTTWSKCAHESCSLPPSICSFYATHFSRDGLPPEQALARYLKNCATNTRRSRESIPCSLDVPYGNQNHSASKTEKMKVDLYGFDALPDDAPAYLFVHGGLWAAGSKDISAGMVEVLTAAGIKVAVLGYNIAPAVTVSAIVDEVVCGIEFVAKKIGEYGTTDGVGGLFVSGHSAGGHLVAMALVRIANKKSDALRVIKGAFILSGIFDIQPFVDCQEEAEKLGLTASDAETCSPGRFLEQWVGLVQAFPVWVVHGQFEPAAYVENANYFHSTLSKKLETCDCDISNKRLQIVVIPGVDHMELVERMSDPEYELVRLILEGVKQG